MKQMIAFAFCLLFAHVAFSDPTNPWSSFSDSFSKSYNQSANQWQQQQQANAQRAELEAEAERLALAKKEELRLGAQKKYQEYREHLEDLNILREKRKLKPYPEVDYATFIQPLGAESELTPQTVQELEAGYNRRLTYRDYELSMLTSNTKRQLNGLKVKAIQSYSDWLTNSGLK